MGAMERGEARRKWGCIHADWFSDALESPETAQSRGHNTLMIAAVLLEDEQGYQD